MDAKLTLKLNGEIIEKAKAYAQARNTSLSRLIENFLFKVTADAQNKDEISPLVKSLSGIIDLPKNYDIKKGYKNHVLKKYSK